MSRIGFMDKNVDKNEHFLLDGIPARSLSLRLTRNQIRMHHERRWRIDKTNVDHDLIVCLEGSGIYRLPEGELTLQPGDAMLIPAYTRFSGRHGGGLEPYQGVAQHFSLDLFDRGDAIQQMELVRKVPLHDWQALSPLVRLFREAGTDSATTLSKHHQFMVILLAYLQQAFTHWKEITQLPAPQDRLSIEIAQVAATLSADPMGTEARNALSNVHYNSDYFRRAFRDRVGVTPKQFHEQKRMEFATLKLGRGSSVKEVAVELGYADPHYFSRQFKRHIGSSPSNYRVRQGR